MADPGAASSHAPGSDAHEVNESSSARGFNEDVSPVPRPGAALPRSLCHVCRKNIVNSKTVALKCQSMASRSNDLQKIIPYKPCGQVYCIFCAHLYAELQDVRIMLTESLSRGVDEENHILYAPRDWTCCHCRGECKVVPRGGKSWGCQREVKSYGGYRDGNNERAEVNAEAPAAEEVAQRVSAAVGGDALSTEAGEGATLDADAAANVSSALLATNVSTAAYGEGSCSSFGLAIMADVGGAEAAEGIFVDDTRNVTTSDGDGHMPEPSSTSLLFQDVIDQQNARGATQNATIAGEPQPLSLAPEGAVENVPPVSENEAMDLRSFTDSIIPGDPGSGSVVAGSAQPGENLGGAAGGNA
jgi:hypothetical protein